MGEPLGDPETLLCGMIKSIELTGVALRPQDAFMSSARCLNRLR